MSSSGERRAATIRDLLEEAKKRIVLLVICAVGLSYLMSLTSPSVLVNLPAALFLLITLRYMSLDLDMRRKAATYKGKSTSGIISSERRHLASPRVLIDRSDWKQKVNSPVVEEAIEKFNTHIISEWVTDLWYSRITPDRQGPEELVLIMNGVLGEISSRMRNINLIEFLTSDIINLLRIHLELFRACNAKIEEQQSRFLSVEERDMELKSVLASENKLHPILFSAEAEHKVLQHVMDGLIFLTFKKEDLQCSLFRYIVRELLACVVIRPVLNLVNPRFINERIESILISASLKKTEGSKTGTKLPQDRINASPIILSDDISQSPDPSMKGVELVRLKKDDGNKAVGSTASDNLNGALLSKDPLLSMDTKSTRSWNSLPDVQNVEGNDIQRHNSGGEWGDKLEVFSRRKTEALAPEHFDNMWTKGKDYKRKDDINQLTDPLQANSLAGASNLLGKSKVLSAQNKKQQVDRHGTLEKYVPNSGYIEGPGEYKSTMQGNLPKGGGTSIISVHEEDKLTSASSTEAESWSSSFTEDEDTSNVTGLDSPGIIVWDGRSKRNFSRIHHPLETLDRQKNKKMSKNHLHSKRLHRTKSEKKRSRSSSHNGHVWQEIERTRLGVGQDLLHSSKVNAKPGESSEDSEAEMLDRIYSGATTSSAMSFASLPESHTVAASSAKKSIISDSFFTLRCEVFGANIVKSGSKTIAVYCISVTDVNNKNWSIKRRFQHFEELHRRLKEFPEYNLHLPPKHFLSTGLDVFVIQERCTLLDQYLKNLLQLPTVSCSIEVWDFLSVDSQMYVFSNSLSIIETLSVRERSKEYQEYPIHEPFSSKKETSINGTHYSASIVKDDHLSYGPASKAKDQSLSPSKKPEKDPRKDFGDSGSYSLHPDQKNILPPRNLEKPVNAHEKASNSVQTSDDTASDPTLPSEWVPPNLSVPILDLVDVILQLKDGGWIRRKAFWVAKQILQLGMGDAFDDWLIEKIQLLRRGSVVASGVRRLEQILWPDGIFITKHPKRQRPSPASPSDSSPRTPNSSPKVKDVQQMEDMQQIEAERRAKLVYELMIDKAPATVVGLVGRKEYEHCAKDLYYFIQSSVCMKLLTFDLLAMLLMAAFPELDDVFRQVESEKEKFGKFESN